MSKSSCITFFLLSLSDFGKLKDPIDEINQIPPGTALPRALLLLLESSFVRNSKLLSSLSSAGSKYSATIGRCHSFAETVLILSLSFRRLVRAFHCIKLFALLNKGCKYRKIDWFTNTQVKSC